MGKTISDPHLVLLLEEPGELYTDKHCLLFFREHTTLTVVETGKSPLDLGIHHRRRKTIDVSSGSWKLILRRKRFNYNNSLTNTLIFEEICILIKNDRERVCQRGGGEKTQTTPCTLKLLLLAFLLSEPALIAKHGNFAIFPSIHLINNYFMFLHTLILKHFHCQAPRRLFQQQQQQRKITEFVEMQKNEKPCVFRCFCTNLRRLLRYLLELFTCLFTSWKLLETQHFSPSFSNPIWFSSNARTKLSLAEVSLRLFTTFNTVFKHSQNIHCGTIEIFVFSLSFVFRENPNFFLKKNPNFLNLFLRITLTHEIRAHSSHLSWLLDVPWSLNPEVVLAFWQKNPKLPKFRPKIKSPNNRRPRNLKQYNNDATKTVYTEQKGETTNPILLSLPLAVWAEYYYYLWNNNSGAGVRAGMNRLTWKRRA